MFIRSSDEKELENESFEALSYETMPKIFLQDEVGQSMRWSKLINGVRKTRFYSIILFCMKIEGNVTNYVERFIYCRAFRNGSACIVKSSSKQKWNNCRGHEHNRKRFIFTR